MASFFKSLGASTNKRVYHRSFEQTQVNAQVFPSLPALRKALPEHCLKSSLWRSLSYVLRDGVFVVALFALMALWGSHLAAPLNTVAWLAYWFLQGTVFWGLFVLGHDCGHQSFSKSKLVNEVFGNLLHGFLLIPYHAWALSHRHHHLNTGNVFKDEPFVPEVSSSKAWRRPKSHWLPSLRRLSAGFLGLMWFPYLIGFSKYLQSHFWPWDPMFKNHRRLVGVSVAVVGLMLCLLAYASSVFGFKAVLAYYGVPIFVSSSWLVVTTFLHHNQIDIPWYTDQNWTFVKGNLSTVDRSYGIFNNIVHDIGTHQLHHLFIFIPHYHLREATVAFREAFPHLMRYSHRSIFAEYVRATFNYGLHGYMAKGTEVFTYRDVLAQRRQAQAETTALTNPSESV